MPSDRKTTNAAPAVELDDLVLRRSLDRRIQCLPAASMRAVRSSTSTTLDAPHACVRPERLVIRDVCGARALHLLQAMARGPRSRGCRRIQTAQRVQPMW